MNKARTLVMFCIACLLGVLVAVFSGKSAYAAGSSSSMAEKVALETWYVDGVSYDSSAWFQFTTSKNEGSKYWICMVPFEADPLYEGNAPEGDYEYGTDAYLKTNQPGTYLSCKENILELEPDTSYRFKINGYVHNLDFYMEDSYSVAFIGKIRFRFIIKEIPASVATVKTSSSYKTPVAIRVGQWYQFHLKHTYKEGCITKKQYFTFKTPERKKSRYATVMLTDGKLIRLHSFYKVDGKYKDAGYAEEEAHDISLYFNLLNPNTSVLMQNTYQRYDTFFFEEHDECDIPDFFDYSFLILEMPDLPGKQVIRSLKADTESLNLSYNKSSLSSRYQIAYKTTTASSWKYTTTTGTSKSISNLLKGKTYKVKVRSQRKINGRYHSGQWSATKSVTVE